MRIKTEIPLSLGFIKDSLGLKSTACDHTTYVSAICTDTRKVIGEELFIGLRGEDLDGSVFIPDIKDRALCTVGALSSDADIKVENTGTSLLRLANAYKKLLPIKSTVAITGSVGKSTTKNLLTLIMKSKFQLHSTYKNLNNEIGVPFTVFSAPKNTELLICESGMNHRGELERISRCIEPDVSVITKIGSAHIGNLGTREKIAEAKLEILSGMKEKFAIIPFDEELLSSKMENYKTVSTKNSSADYFLQKRSDDNFVLKHPNGKIDIRLSEISAAGFHVSECLAFALATAIECGMNTTEIKKAVEDIDFGIFSNTVAVKDLKIINDSYNASPEATEEALKSLSKLYTKKSALLGDMLELGDFSEELHYKIGLCASKSGIDKLYLIGAFSDSVLHGAVAGGFDKNRIFINEDAQQPEITAEQILTHSKDEVILFKASRKIRLERIIDILKKAEK